MQIEENNAALRNLSALVDFSNLVNSSLNLNFSLNNLILTCFTKFHTTKGIIALIDDERNLVIESQKGFRKEIVENFPIGNYEKLMASDELNKFIKDNKLGVCEKIISSNGPQGIILLGEKLSREEYTDADKDFLKTMLNIGATAIENSVVFEKLRIANRNLDSKVNQLSSLFDLSKEFSGILEIGMVSKMLVYSILGQLLVSKYTVLTCEGNVTKILDSKFPPDDILKLLDSINYEEIISPIVEEQVEERYNELSVMGVKAIVPMMIKGKVKGLILLGERRNQLNYSKSDIEYISSVGGLAIISIENSLLFKQAIEKQKLEKDLEIARKIQKNLLPKTIPKLKNFEIAAYNQSARQVGGDYYDLVRLDEDRTLFAVGDVSGKGVQAALLMANVQAFLKSICKQDIELGSASDLINDLVSENTSGGSFITFFWAILNDKTKTMTSVNMGHNPPLLVRDGKIIKLKKGGMILGVMETIVPYISETTSLKQGDILIIFTDGVTEAMNIAEEEYTDERLEELAFTFEGLTAQQILDKINADVKSYTKGAEQSDDITLMIIKVL
ncbi:MAG: PP2C family protein-serine/threonine phosphatase [Bacteroidetes bacterium]|nr:PP2C family protein-serine/threonine phosphatase [Bacteroidota bacterium]